MKKIVTIVGARPQFIKMALVSEALRQRKIREVVIHTGQHYDKEMSELFFRELDISKPDYNLRVGSGQHGEQTARMLIGIEKALLAEEPAMVLVYGDTNSTLAGALAASKLNIKLAHIEAGLRSYNMKMPEEINRIVTDKLSSILFCPTKIAVENLKKEGISKGVYLVGDVMYDLLRGRIAYIGKSKYNFPYILCTIHRAENTDSLNSMKKIFKALAIIGYRVVLPLHPRTHGSLKKYKIIIPPNVIVTKPVGYKDMLSLERYAKVIITDSGGVQKEALILGTPCVTIRGETEWLETVECGMNKLAGTSSKSIIDAVKKSFIRRKSISPGKIYGDGTAHKKIAMIISKELKAL